MLVRHLHYFDQSNITTIFSCLTCHSQLINQQDIVSKAFQGRNGSAFLVEKVENIHVGTQEERMLMTGVHTVADLYCRGCQTKIGWRYLKSPDQNQKYKEGRYIIEKTRVIKECNIL